MVEAIRQLTGGAEGQCGAGSESGCSFRVWHHQLRPRALLGCSDPGSGMTEALKKTAQRRIRRSGRIRQRSLPMPAAGKAARVYDGLRLRVGFALQVCARSAGTSPIRRGRSVRNAGRWISSGVTVPDGGELISENDACRTSVNTYFRERMPWRIGTIKLDAGTDGSGPCSRRRRRIRAGEDDRPH